MNYTSSEALEQVLERRDRLQRKREHRRLGWFSLGLCVVLLVLTLTVSSIPVTGHDGSGTATMGSFLLEEKAGGIFAVVVLAFLFGVLITLLCIRKRKTPEKAEKTMDSQYVENGGNQA